jgi:hypothetical protein
MRSTQWQLGNLEPSEHLLKDKGKPRKPVSRSPVAGLSGCTLTSIQQTSRQNYMRDFLTLP